MKFQLFGTGFKSFDLPKYAVGVTTLKRDVPTGEYAVERIISVNIQRDCSIGVHCTLLADDENLDKNKPSEIVFPTLPIGVLKMKWPNAKDEPAAVLFKEPDPIDQVAPIVERGETITTDDRPRCAGNNTDTPCGHLLTSHSDSGCMVITDGQYCRCAIAQDDSLDWLTSAKSESTSTIVTGTPAVSFSDPVPSADNF